MTEEYRKVQERFRQMVSDSNEYNGLWQDIQDHVGIQVDVDYHYTGQNNSKSEQRDEYIDDPTSAIAVNQFGDYLIGVLWGNGENVFRIKPSRYVLDLANEQMLKNWYEYATDQTLYHMNHPDAGLRSKLHEYAYDQAAFGNSAIGVYLNARYLEGLDDNALIYKSYGVDNAFIDEGMNGLPEYFFCTYHWTVARIVGEFASRDGETIEEALEALPKDIREAWKKNNINESFRIVFGFYPREDFNPKLQGKRGTKYKGVWFMPDGSEERFFFEEDFASKPVGWVRMIKVRGEKYGRGSGTMLLSTIRSVNFMVGTGIEVIEKQANPSLGILSNALFGDSVLDTSPNGLTVFNPGQIAGNAPTFPIYDVGDPTALMQFLVPYLNDKVTTAFKVDALLDFNAQADMTATEAMQRFTIRSKSVAGILSQQKTEGMDVWCPTSIKLLMAAGELGVDPQKDPQAVDRLTQLNKTNRVIPEAVLEVMEMGKPWFELEYNNEMDRMIRSEAVQKLLQIVQSTLVIAQAYPQIIEAVDWYKVLEEINDNMDVGSKILLTEQQFKQRIQQLAQQQQAAQALQAGKELAATEKDAAQANKANADARRR